MELRSIVWRMFNLVIGSLGFLLVFSTEERVLSIPIPKDQNYVQRADEWIRLDSLTQRKDSIKSFSKYVSKVNETLGIQGTSRKEDSLRANILDNISKKWIYNNPTEARECLLNALKIRKRLWPDSMHRDIKRIYYNLGLVALELKNYHQAINYYDSSEQGNAFLVAGFSEIIKIRKGETYFEMGEYSESLAYYERAFENIDLINAPNLSSLAQGYAKVYRKTQQYKLGITKLMDISEQTNQNKDMSPTSLGTLNILLGNLWGDSLNRLNGRPIKSNLSDTAIKYYEKAAFWVDKYKDEDDKSLNRGIIYRNIAEIYRRKGLAHIGENTLGKYLSQLNYKLPRFGKAHFYLTRGEIYYDQYKLAQARIDFDSAHNWLNSDFLTLENDPNSLSRNFQKYKTDLMTLMDNMARLHIRIHEQNPSNTEALEQGINWYDSLFQYITYLRGDLISDEAKLNLAEQSQPILEKAMEGCIQLYRLRKDARYLERVFTLSEQSKAFTLLEASRLKNLSESLPRELRELEQRLDQERSDLERKLAASSPESPDRKELNNLRSKNFNEIRLFLQRLKDEQSLYYRIKYKGADLKIPELQESLLKPDQALVEYYYTDSTLCILVVRKDALEARFVPISRSVLETKVHTFKQLLENPGTLVSETREQRILSLGGELYEVLWSPIEDLLPERVTIIPHAVLNTLPFEALYTGCGSLRFSDAIKNSEFLLQRQAVSYSFSANLLHEMQQIRPRTSYAGGKKTALLQTDFHHDLSANPRSQSLNEGLLQARKYLVPLGRPQAREINAIKEKITSAKIFPTATKDDFIAAATKYQIIHVATHGILNERDPSLSFISFTQAQDSLNPDELLFIKDFKPYNWGLDLVFFSACQTANGRYREGEGNISMARGLTTAGVRSFVSTLWDVPVDAKAKIAPDFYDNYLKQNKPKDLSLTLAKRKVAKEYPDPVHWSGYVLIGASD